MRIEKKTAVPIDKTKVKKVFREKLITALIVAPSMAVLLLSAIYALYVESLQMGLDTPIPVMMSCLTLLSLIASTVLATVYKRRFAVAFLAVVFLCCFLCYLSFLVSGTTDLYADGFFEMLMLILVLPVWSYMPLCLAAAPAAEGIAALIITGVLALLNLGAGIALTVPKKRSRSDEGQDRG